MRTLPTSMIRVLAPFAPLFSERVWQHVQVLLAGAVLAPGKRTVSSALRAMGLEHHKQFHRYHRVLSRASWSSLAVSHVLLGLLVELFVPDGPLVVGIDETLERRWGPKIAARGIYRDPVRSSHEHFAKASGLRWVCMMLLVPVPWAGRVWALPFLSVLAYSERHATELGKRHKKLTDWAWQMLPGCKALVAQPRDRGRCRQHVRLSQAPRPLSESAQSGHLRHALTPGRRPLRTGSTAPPRPDGAPAAEGRAPAEPLGGGRKPEHRLDEDRGGRLVR